MKVVSITTVFIIILVALISCIVISSYMVVKKFYALKNFRENVTVGDSVQFYHSQYQCFTVGVVVKRGTEYVNVKILNSNRTYLLHINDITPEI